MNSRKVSSINNPQSTEHSFPLDIKILNPLDYDDWNEQIAELPGSTIFHTSNWAAVLCESYGYQPRYFTALKENRIVGCIPMMHVDSLITGRRGVSLPFTDECHPLGSPECVETLLKIAKSHALETGWKRIQLRGNFHTIRSVPSSTFKSHVIDLNQSKDQLLRKLRKSTRRNIEKANRNKVGIHDSSNARAVKTFCLLNCMTRRRHGLPPQPKRFFDRIEKHILLPGMGFVLTAEVDGGAVASAVFFHFKQLVVYKYSASDMAYQNLRPNNLLIWHAIEKCRAAGFSQIHLGRTEVHHRGLLQFKRGWGAIEKDLHYYDYSPKDRRYYQNNGTLRSSYTLFKKMPMSLLKLSGRILYRHVG